MNPSRRVSYGKFLIRLIVSEQVNGYISAMWRINSTDNLLVGASGILPIDYFFVERIYFRQGTVSPPLQAAVMQGNKLSDD